MRKILSLFIVAGLLSACANDPNQKQNMGTVLGGIGGALIGSTIGGGEGKTLAIAAGAIAGAFVGNQIGKSMDENDRRKLESNAQNSLEKGRTGQASTWNNPDSGNYGSFTPTKTYQSNNSYCREFTQQVTVAGKTQSAYGTACRQPDGSWKIIQ